MILVGNKIDLRGGEVTNEALEEEIIPIMNEFKVSTRGIIYVSSVNVHFYRRSKHAWNAQPSCL